MNNNIFKKISRE